MKERRANFFDFARFTGKKFLQMMKFALKQAQKWNMMESNANTGIHLLIFSGKNLL